MSFVITDTSQVFTDPASVDILAEGSNPNAVNAVSAPVRLTGANQTFTTTGATGSEVQQLVVDGANNFVTLAPGAANVTAIGAGAIIESSQASNTAGNVIKLGSASAANTFNDTAFVATAATVVGNTPGSTATIASVSGNSTTNFSFYASGGQGNDEIVGSDFNDFIRGGAGNDSLSAGAGNDLIRGGAGSDTVFGGTGADTLYYTSDQLDGATDVFADFGNGADVIAVDRSQVASTASISGLGSNTIILNGASGSATIVSQGRAINASDINFVG